MAEWNVFDEAQSEKVMREEDLGDICTEKVSLFGTEFQCRRIHGSGGSATTEHQVMTNAGGTKVVRITWL